MIDERTQYLIKKYDRPVPRYTSFPTAVQFRDGFNQKTYAQILKNLPTDKPVSLYVHIPFCHNLCHYCGCNTKIVATYRPIERYIDTLLREIELIGDIIPKNINISRIHFGGGSPNYAKSKDISRILYKMSCFFDISDETQIDMECDPRLLDKQKIIDYAALGISRISLGIQDFNTDVQNAINRVQPFDMVQSLMSDFHENGIEDINFDLITGLPAQTMQSVEQTIEQAIELSPKRLAVFAYAHVPWMKKHQILLEKYDRPDTSLRYAMNERVNEKLIGAGYHEIGIDHYAKSDDMLYKLQQSKELRRNFQGYTDDTADVIIGLGLSSISNLNHAYVQNNVDAPAYHAAIKEGNFPISRGCTLSADDKIRRKLIERLMCDFMINFADYPEIEIPYARLETLQQDGLIEMNEDGLHVTQQGKIFVRVVAACFDPYLETDTQHHAKAI